MLRARHTGLPDFDSGVFTTVTFWIDVDRADHGPEFVTDVIPNAGGMRLLSVEGWNRADQQVRPCPGMRARADVFTDGPVAAQRAAQLPRRPGAGPRSREGRGRDAAGRRRRPGLGRRPPALVALGPQLAPPGRQAPPVSRSAAAARCR